MLRRPVYYDYAADDLHIECSDVTPSPSRWLLPCLCSDCSFSGVRGCEYSVNADSSVVRCLAVLQQHVAVPVAVALTLVALALAWT